MKLVVVESPAKAKTIEKYLGSSYKVLSSYGHVRDLPQGELGIDVENDFKPSYEIIAKAKKNLKTLEEAAKKSDLIYLATDPDREGEAIAWHLVQALGLNGKNTKSLKPYERIAFHEITKQAIEEALKNPRKIDLNLVDAQQARRILDRLVGYKLSPFLWKKVIRGLSAGRVQSVTVRLICERESEIKNFNPQEYWSISALFKKQGKEFEALLAKKDGKILDKFAVKNKEEAEAITKDLEGAEYKTKNIERKEAKKNPPPPFTTSTLQQEAWRKFHFPAKMTMSVAQGLYEKGFITYHRTDSVNLSEQSLFSAKEFIIKKYGENYWTGYFRKYKTKSKSAQEAHEAIRPTSADNIPESLQELDSKQSKLYALIWQRFLASQMKEALYDSTAAEIAAKNYIFKAVGLTQKFDGFLRVYPLKFQETELPSLEVGEILELEKLSSLQHFTQPPARYSEATLVKTLENYGIGRPSTYAPTLETIQNRGYVKKDDKKLFCPTEIGVLVNDLLVKHFSEIVDIDFTAKMEEDLDKIANAQINFLPVIKNFYEPFAENLKQKNKEVPKEDLSQETDEICPECGKNLVIRISRYGKFYACSGYPECKYKKDAPSSLGIKCPKCQEGELVERRTKTRKIFYGCSNWPKCDYALWDKPTGEICPECGGLMAKNRWGRIKCSNKECPSNILPKK